MIVMIDNYDSFTYNLYQYAGVINPDIRVFRNDKIDVAGIRKLKPSHIMISPGPGYPKDAGISMEVVKTLGVDIPILGICLGHQAIAEAFGGEVVRAPYGPVHGKKTECTLDTACPLFKGLEEKQTVGRYHSLIVKRDTLPQVLAITAQTADGIIMGIAHRQYPVYGIQFHPESVLTDTGMTMIENFLQGGNVQ